MMSTLSDMSLHPILKGLLDNRLPLPDADAVVLNAEESAFHLALAQFRNAPPASEELARARGEVLVGLAESTGNPSLLLAAYLEWFECYQHVGAPSDLEFLIHGVEEFRGRKWPPILEAWVLQVKYTWAFMRQHKAQCLYLIKQCIDCAPAGSEIWSTAIRCYSVHMAETGRLKDIQGYLDEYQRVMGMEHPGLMWDAFANACHNGDTKSAIPLLPAARAAHERGNMIGAYAVARVFFELLAQHVPQAAVSFPIPYQEDCAFCRLHGGVDPDATLMTTRHLLQGQTERALDSAREYAAALSEYFFYLPRFDGYDMVRAELAAGNRDSALVLLRKRFRNGLYIWIDDLFTARAALLHGKCNAAESMFRRCLGAAGHYGAENRLRFELLLACELPPTILLRWMGMIHTQTPHDGVSFITALPRPTSAPPESPPIRLPASPKPVASVRTDKSSSSTFVGQGRASLEIRAKIESFASIDPPVLLTGETGVGKELVAQQIHDSGSRRNRPFVAVNCAALSSSLLLSELFGHVRGAFTGATRQRRGLFETAADGTLLLDEIGDLAPEVQGALLRVLETGEFRPVGSDVVHKSQCRILAATHRDLASLVEENRFRRDLYYRLSRLEIRIPPLRERKEDLIPIALHFLRRYHPNPGACGIAEELREAFLAYPWNGNVRELKSAMEMLCLLYGTCNQYTLKEMCAAEPHWSDIVESRKDRPASTRHPLGKEEPHESRAAPPPAIRSRQSSPHPVKADGGNEERGQPPANELHQEPLREHPLDRLDRLEDYIRLHRRITCRQVLQVFHVSYPTATRMLRTLIDKGVVRKVEPNRSPRSHYFESV